MIENRLQGLELAQIRQKPLFYGPDGCALHDNFDVDTHIDLGQSNYILQNGEVRPTPNPIIPAMTSNSSGVFVASCSRYYNWSSGGPAYKAFDGDKETGYLDSSFSTKSLPAYLQIDTGSATEIDMYSITSRHIQNTNYDGFPIDFQLLGSSDNLNFNVVDEQSGLVWTNNETKYFMASAAYRYYRLYVTNTSTGVVTIMEFQIYTVSPFSVVSKCINATAVPERIYFIVLQNGYTDLAASRDDGMHYAAVPLVHLYDNHDGFGVYYGFADVTAQSEEANLRYAIDGTGTVGGISMWCE